MNDNTGERAESHLGHYGLGASKLDIQPLIEQRIKENTPSAKRLRQSRKVQTKRRELKVFDRTKSTSALLKMKPKVPSLFVLGDVAGVLEGFVTGGARLGIRAEGAVLATSE